MTGRHLAVGSSDTGAEFGPGLRFLRALWELNHALESASRSMKKRFAVTGPERLFIRIVGHRPGITPAEVADILHVDRSSVTPLIKKLERRRLVTRTTNPLDARSFHLSLTALGQRIDAMRTGTIEAVVEAAIGGQSSGDMIATATMLVRVAERLRAAFVVDAPSPRTDQGVRRRRVRHA